MVRQNMNITSTYGSLSTTKAQLYCVVSHSPVLCASLADMGFRSVLGSFLQNAELSKKCFREENPEEQDRRGALFG